MPATIDPHYLLIALLLFQRLLERRSETFFQSFGLTSAQFNILHFLANRDDKIDQSTLVNALLVGKSSISIVLNRMATAGLITRHPHASDRRQVVLTLTPRGRALWRKVSPEYDKVVQLVFGSLPLSRRTSFLDDLERLYEALRREFTPGTVETSVSALREVIEQFSTTSFEI